MYGISSINLSGQLDLSSTQYGKKKILVEMLFRKSCSQSSENGLKSLSACPSGKIEKEQLNVSYFFSKELNIHAYEFSRTTPTLFISYVA